MCGFLNLHPFFPAFVYPVFCKSDSKGNVHYFFEDGERSTIQMFHEINFESFPKLITLSDLGHHNYTVGSETVYAYALSQEYVVWGDVGDFIPRLKLILPTLPNHAQKKRVKFFVSSHWVEYRIKCMKRFIQNVSTSEWEWRVLHAAICTACFLAIVYVAYVFYGMYQKPASSGPDEPDNFIDFIPDVDIPPASSPIESSPPDDDNTSVHYQRLNVTSSSVIIDYLTNTFVIGNPYIDDSDCHLASDDVLAVDSQSGKEYDIQELGNTLLLIPYRDGDKETIFYGSLSMSGNWDGRCVTNIYEDQKLQLVTDANYDNGKLLSYKQMYTYITAKEELVWAFSSRIVQEDNTRSGETWTYYYDDISQNFSYDNVTEEDIILADQFDKLIDHIGARKEGYYNGNTSNGAFNDSTGQAYMVKYFKEDGMVRNLYIGKVKDGFPSDQTGSAWEIGKKEFDQPRYSHFIGTFSEGKDDQGTWTDDLSQEKIDAFLDGYTFNCSLPGLRSGDVEQKNLDLFS